MWVVQSGDELHQRRLAGAVVPNNGDRFAPRNLETDVLESRLVLAFIAVRDVAELDAFGHRVPHRNGTLRRAYLRLEVEELEQCLEVELVFIHRLQAAEQRGECLRDAVGGLDVQRQTADADRAAQRSIRDIEKRQAGRQDRQHRPPGTCQVAPDDERAIFGVVALEEVRKSLDEEVANGEQLDFFVVGIAGHQAGQIGHHPPQRRLPAHHLVPLPAIPRARDKGRNRCQQSPSGDEPLEIHQ